MSNFLVFLRCVSQYGNFVCFVYVFQIYLMHVIGYGAKDRITTSVRKLSSMGRVTEVADQRPSYITHAVEVEHIRELGK
jgi:hypothetical protein